MIEVSPTPASLEYGSFEAAFAVSLTIPDLVAGLFDYSDTFISSARIRIVSLKCFE